MFTSARIKLTAWYLLIIMVISVSFSLFIYRVLSFEINRFALNQRFRIERRLYPYDLMPTIDLELINDTKHRLAMTLVAINGTILAISGTLGFFLAGKTLEPIQKMLEDQNRFISDSSHELRTPLTALKSSLEVNLRDKKLTLAAAKKLIKENIEDVNHLQQLSDGLLKLTQYQASTTSTLLVPVNLEKILTDVVDKLRPLAQQKNIILSTALKPVSVLGDPHSLSELFTILLDNAIKYSGPKSTVRLSVVPQGKSVAVSVADNGPGIGDKDLPHIFDRFYRSDVSRSRTEVTGFGLGLSIAQKIATDHHTKINVKSQLGQGSVFTVDFQVRDLN